MCTSSFCCRSESERTGLQPHNSSAFHSLLLYLLFVVADFLSAFLQSAYPAERVSVACSWSTTILQRMALAALVPELL